MRDPARPAAAALLLVAWLCVTAAIPQWSFAADGPREAHGAADAFATAGVALAWGVLRGATESTTLVVVRIAVARDAFAAVAVVGLDPFTQRQQTLLAATPVAAGIDVRVPRAHFADFPRTEVRLYGMTDAVGAGAPALVVYYLGVPDTTPEFASEAALDAYLVQRIVRARTDSGSRTP
jgi:hypothetical protein